MILCLAILSGAIIFLIVKEKEATVGTAEMGAGALSMAGMRMWE